MAFTRTRVIVLSVATVAVIVGALLALPLFDTPAEPSEPVLTLVGIEEGALLNAEEIARAAFRVGVDREEALADVLVELNGSDVTGQAYRSTRALMLDASGVEDGEYELVATLGEQQERRTFRVDTTPPELSIDEPEGPAVGDGEFELTGTVDDPDATVVVGDVEATVDGDRFVAEVRPSAAGPVTFTVTATDAAGNSASDTVEYAWVPSRVRVDGVRAVHVSFHGWMSSSKRDPVMEMIEDGLINSVQLDLKDESGMVGYHSEIEMAHAAGAVGGWFDLEEQIAILHDMGVHVSGRIVAFADPVMARHEWANGDRDRVIQTADGDFYTGRYAGFINFAHEDVRQYNIDIAVEAARAGIDDILWDYIRRPDGRIEGFRFPGLEEGVTPQESIVEFLREADEAIAPYGVEHGASVYGIAVDRPHEIGQDIDGMARHLDYVAPMLYPSHWGPGEYGVANPNQQPYDIIHESLRRFVDKVDGTRSRIVPWLQDFSMGHRYGVAEVKAQIDAAADLGVEEWMMWNAGMNFTRDAYPPAPEGVTE